MDSQGFAAVDWFVFRSAFFASYDLFLNMLLLANVFFSLSLQSGQVLFIYIFILFSIFFPIMTLFWDILLLEMFFLSLLNLVTNGLTYIVVHLQATLSLSKLISTFSLYHSSAS
jgi:hypothetical protein